MSNDFYNPSGTPSTGAALSSSAIRAEFTSLQTAFDKLPTMNGHGNEFVIVSAAGTALSSVNNSYALSVLGAQPLSGELTALAALDATVGAIIKTANNTYVRRSVVGTNNEITVTNGNGAAGNVTLSLPTALTFSGKTVTGGTFAGISVTSAAVLASNNAAITGGSIGNVAADNLAITASTMQGGTVNNAAATNLTQLTTANATITGGAVTGLTQLGTNNATLTGGTISGVTLNSVVANNVVSNNLRISAANIVSGTINNVSVTNLTTALNVTDGGTGCNTLTQNSLMLGNGTSPVQLVAPGTANNVLVSDGSTWKSGNISQSGGSTVFNSGALNSGSNLVVTNIPATGGDIVISFNNVSFNTSSRSLVMRLSTDGVNFSSVINEYNGISRIGATIAAKAAASVVEPPLQSSGNEISGTVIVSAYHGNKIALFRSSTTCQEGDSQTDGAFTNSTNPINAVRFSLSGSGVFDGAGTYEVCLVR